MKKLMTASLMTAVAVPFLMASPAPKAQDSTMQSQTTQTTKTKKAKKHGKKTTSTTSTTSTTPSK